MAMQRVDIERWAAEREAAVIQWLTDNFGPEGAHWRVALGYDFVELYMQEEIYTLFALRWA